MPSSVIAQFSYDWKTMRLTVTFVSGRTYQYFDVPASAVAGLRFATSKGTFFNSRIRDHYDYKELKAA